MSGRKQHHIPQCLLAGFEASRSGKGPQVFVYRGTTAPYLSWIGDVAAQRDFYSKPTADGTCTLDDEITSYENRLGPMLARMRESSTGLISDSTVPAELVAHLCIRAAFVRNYFDAGAREMAASVGTFLSDSDAVRGYLRLDESEPIPVLQAELDKALDCIGALPPDPGARSLIKRALIFNLREDFAGFHEAQQGEMGAALKAIRDSLPSVIRQGHQRVLHAAMAPEQRIEGLASLRWWKVRSDEHLVLPDCVAISRVGHAGSDFAPYVTHSSEEIHCVLLPLDSHQLLIGCRGELAVDGEMIRDFNRVAAGCSIDFFVSAVRDERTNEIAATLGQASLDAVTTAVREGLSELSQRGNTTATRAVAMEVKDEQPHVYRVSFAADIDQATAQAIADAVKIVVDSFSDPAPLHFLDGIVFAADYERALNDLDRGFSASQQLETTSISYGTGIAMAPLVIREGKPKCMLVMRAWIGLALLNENAPLFRMALQTLVCMVARVKYMSTVHRAFPDFLLKPIDDPWDAFFIRHVDSLSSAYFGARASAHIDPDCGAGYGTLLKDALAAAAESVPRIRLAYRTDEYLDAFLSQTLAALGDILSHAASALGHFDELQASLASKAADEELNELLKTLSLHKWIEIYRLDLARIHECRGAWASTQDLLAISIHVERLLWAFGVFPWRTSEGLIRVDIPLHTDHAALEASFKLPPL